MSILTLVAVHLPLDNGTFLSHNTLAVKRIWEALLDAYNTILEPQGLLKSKLAKMNFFWTISSIFPFSFGYPAANTASSTAATSTHLQNQNYQACVRRSSGMCYICWAAWHTSTIAAAMISSFGLSNPAADADNSATGTECVTDYVIVRP